MGIHTESGSKPPATDARIDTNTVAAERPTATAKTGTPVPPDNTSGFSEQPRLVGLEADGSVNDLDEFVSTITTIAQSWCERVTDYADIEALVTRLPIDQCTLVGHDALAPY